MKKLCLLLAVIGLFSCSQKTKLETLIPETAEVVGKVDLPAIATKSISWELIFDAFSTGSDSEEEVGNAQFPLDVTRQILFFSQAKQITFLIPITDQEGLEKFILQKTSNTSFLQENEMKYVKFWDYYVVPYSDYVVVSSELKKRLQNQIITPLASEILLAEEDVFAKGLLDVHEDQVSGEWSVNFEQGKVISKLNATHSLVSILEGMGLRLSFDKAALQPQQEFDAQVTTRIIKSKLAYFYNLSREVLGEYELLYHHQIKSLGKHLTGEVQLYASDKVTSNSRNQSVLVLGASSEVVSLLDSLGEGYEYDEKSGFYIHKHSNQHIKWQDGSLVLSNFYAVPALNVVNSSSSLSISQAVILDRYWVLPSLLFGENVKENFPIVNLALNAAKDANNVTLDLVVETNQQEESSLLTIVNYLQGLDFESVH